jgi:hypothetical protein
MVMKMIYWIEMAESIINDSDQQPTVPVNSSLRFVTMSDSLHHNYIRFCPLSEVRTVIINVLGVLYLRFHMTVILFTELPKRLYINTAHLRNGKFPKNHSVLYNTKVVMLIEVCTTALARFQCENFKSCKATIRFYPKA